MKAMVYRGPYKVRVEEKDIPKIEHPNDAIVRVTRAAICGSDLHLYHGMMPDTRVGTTFGHEFIGVVHEVGPSVENLKVGDRVMVPFNIYCGTCYFCRKGLYSNCHNVNPNATAVGGIYGYSHTCGGYDGGQAEFVRVPLADVGPSIIPEWLHDEDALMMTDALATGYFGAQLGDIVEGDTVVVFGAGPVGQFAARSAWLMGAGRVIVIDHLDYRLQKAREFAFAETISFTEVDDIVLELKKQTDWLGADVVIDALGDGRLRSAVQRRQVRRRYEQGAHDPHQPGAGEAAVAAAARAHPGRAAVAARHHHPPHTARAHCGGLSLVLRQTRRLHQDRHHH
jgi:threonine dehydrogenase-like Zn-dependent dehydrogenase